MSDKRHRKSPREKPPVGKLLFVSYFFPPTAGGGVFRPLAMVKYLSRLGWDITLITATKPKHYPADDELTRQIPDDLKVIKIPVVYEGGWFRRLLGKLNLDWISRALVTPDERIFWAEKACAKVVKLNKDENFDLIYTTGPPYSILLTGLWLKRMKEINSKWVAEFRDPWIISPYVKITNFHQKRFATDTELDIMEKADAVIMVTDTFATMMKEKYPRSSMKVHCVQNGFDEDDFTNLPVRDQWRNDSCTIVAAGTVFGANNMNDFVDALEKIKNQDRSAWKKLTVRFQGLPNATLNRRLLETGLGERCESRGFVTHSENIRDLSTADLLILPVAPAPNCEGHIPSRTYEYLASGSPVLAICPDGDLANLVEPFPQVMRVRPGDIDGIMDIINSSIAKWEHADQTPPPDPNELRSLTRKSRAKEIDIIFRDLIHKEGNEK